MSAPLQPPERLPEYDYFEYSYMYDDDIEAFFTKEKEKDVKEN